MLFTPHNQHQSYCYGKATKEFWKESCNETINDINITNLIRRSNISSYNASNKSLNPMTVVNKEYFIAKSQYYHIRKWESISKTINPLFANFDANWPCFWGETVIGLKAGDGVKWGCGIRFISSPCIIYSFGSANNWEFEINLHQLLPFCEIYTFDPFINARKPPSFVNFVSIGISGCNYIDDENRLFLTLPSIINKLGHHHIDILKVDIEGFEWFSFFMMKYEEWPSIAQLIIEIHLFDNNEFIEFLCHPLQRQKSLKDIINLFESHGLMIFHKEINSQFGGYGTCCAEYSFIQKKWKPHNKYYNKMEITQ